MERQVADGGFSSPRTAVMFLELNTQAQMATSMGQCIRILANVMNDKDVGIAFLLDDLFASERLMDLMPPSRVAEMIADIWASSATGTSLPTTCTVVSERSLVGAAMALVGDDSPETEDGLLVARRYLGVKIEVPALARTFVGDTVPSCPLLAATWQQTRLGRLDHSAGIKQWGQEHKPADRTFTMLNTSLMPVETAVGAILDTCDAEALQHVAYLFQPDHW